MNSNYFTQKDIDELSKLQKRNNKFKRIKWVVEIKNPLDKKLLGSKKYCSLKDMADDNSYLPYDTWRNIAVGRSNVYEPFITICKDLNRDLFYCSTLNNNVNLPPTQIEKEVVELVEEQLPIEDAWLMKTQKKSNSIVNGNLK